MSLASKYSEVGQQLEPWFENLNMPKVKPTSFTNYRWRSLSFGELPLKKPTKQITG
jgi:hypothetical protein